MQHRMHLLTKFTKFEYQDSLSWFSFHRIFSLLSRSSTLISSSPTLTILLLGSAAADEDDDDDDEEEAVRALDVVDSMP